MRPFIGFLRGNERGLTLLELTVVAAIISILAALTAVAVTGTTNTTRAVARTNDISEMQKAVERFNGTAAAYPTMSAVVADASGTEGTDYFQVVEGAGGVNFDVNKDGDTTDTINVIPIAWDTVDPNDSTKAFSPDFIGKPKHAEPSTTITINSGASNNTLSESWVIDSNGTVYVLVAEGVY
jgi:prepilin-type N-terminal cleavage/methylation domain-containing protein